MRSLSLAGFLLVAVFAAIVPSAASAYSEWPAISTKVTTLAQETKLPLTCDLESHVGNIYFQPQEACDFRKFMRFMVELGHYLEETTNAGPSYLVRVHFADRVRSISVSQLIQFSNKPARASDLVLLCDFFSRFEER
jgi:hypothetical protein